MKFLEFKDIDYKKCSLFMDRLIERKKERVIFCSHKRVFTVGEGEKKSFGVNEIKSDRGGSITYHDEGSLMVYFVLKAPSPALFYRKVLKIFNKFFSLIDENIFYDHKKPGFYIENRKIASLGFRYKNGFSKHGVCINLNPNLNEFNKIHPCNLKEIKATSFEKEGYKYDRKKIVEFLKKEIENEFSKT